MSTKLTDMQKLLLDNFGVTQMSKLQIMLEYIKLKDKCKHEEHKE